MKLVAATAATMAYVASAQEEVMPMEGDMMEYGQPWYQFMVDSGNLQIDEEKMIFKIEEPSIFIMQQHDGMKRNIKTPWYNQKYEINTKETEKSRVMEFEAKETIPAYEIINKAYFKAGEYHKNEKVPVENCTDNNPKNCLIKSQVGHQNKMEVDVSHQTMTGKIRMFQKEKYETDMEYKPTHFDMDNGYDYSVNDGLQHLKDMSEFWMMMPEAIQNMMFEETDKEKMYQLIEMDLPEDREIYKLQGKVRNSITHDWEYEMMDNLFVPGEQINHWKSSEWSISMSKDESDIESPTFERVQNNFSLQGSAEFVSADLSEDRTLTMAIDYTQNANNGWSDLGTKTVTLGHADSCMKLFRIIMEGAWEEFFYGSFEESPCVLNAMVEGQTTMPNAETGENELTIYKMGGQWTVSDIFNWDLSVFNSETETLDSIFSIRQMMNENQQEETTVAVHGEDMITINYEKHLEAWNMHMDQAARKWFMMSKAHQKMWEDMMNMDWTNEEAVDRFASQMWNLDYKMQMIGDMQANEVAAWRDYECSHPQFERMESEGIKIHEALKAMHYEKASYMVQKLDLADQTKFWEITMGYVRFLVDPSGEMSNKEIQQMLFDMETYADAYEYVADSLDNGDLMFEPSTEFLMQISGMTFDHQELTEEDYAALYEAYDAVAVSVEDMRNYAQQMRDFEMVELSREEIDAKLNMQCNNHFNMILDYHNQKVSEQVAWFQEYRTQSKYWMEKQLSWINTDRETVEEYYEEDKAELYNLAENLWECEYQMWAAPEAMRVMFDGLDENCQALMMEEYPGIEEWGNEMPEEEHEDVMPMLE